MKGSVWSSERTAQLKVMWMDGLTASQIASRLGGKTTRNAIIGKVHRMKLLRHEKSRFPIQKLQMLDLKEDSCRWPVDDPGEEEFHFCGKKRDHRYPYCTKHARQAYPKIF